MVPSAATTLEIYRRSIAVIHTKSAGRALIHTNEKCGARTRGGAPVSGAGRRGLAGTG